MIESKVLFSKLDKSVNFVLSNDQEARYVRRSDDYFIVYLSSHNGCNKSCRFCHLTQTNQTEFKEATVSELLLQARLVINHYKKQVRLGLENKAQRIHFNWMARGEPLASSVIKHQWHKLATYLTRLASDAGVHDVKYNISTIMPNECGLHTNYKSPDNIKTNLLTWYFKGQYQPVFYYSLYSLNTNFRKKWIPKAVMPELALNTLAQWQIDSGAEVVLHWAFIKGENDNPSDVQAVIDLVNKVGLKARFNLVRYNPYDQYLSEESSKEIIDTNFQTLSRQMKIGGSNIVSRVGLDISASCGTFINTLGE